MEDKFAVIYITLITDFIFLFPNSQILFSFVIKNVFLAQLKENQVFYKWSEIEKCINNFEMEG